MKYLQDDHGNSSTMRAVWVMGVLIILGTWAFICISTGTLQHFTTGDAVFFGMLIGGKVAQKYVEGKNGKTKK